MSKRFTDTEKWKKPFIKNLKGAYKLLWLYIIDDCDHAGVWQVDMDIAQIRIGEKLDKTTAEKLFGEKIEVFDNGEKWFIPSFIDFQYGKLNTKNRVHNSVIDILESYQNKGLVRGLQGRKDKDKDKDKDKEDIGGVGEKETGSWNYKFEHYNPRAKYPPKLQNEKFVEIWDDWCEYRKEKQLDGKMGYTWRMQKIQINKLLELTENNIDQFVSYLQYAMLKGWGMINNKISELEKTEIVIPAWKNNFDLYIKQAKSEFDRLTKDPEFNKLIQELNPGIDVYKSMIQAFSGYWGTNKGWEKKKLSESGEIDWRATLISTIEFNLVKK
jgi:hypothetical protein